jgi:hypothetical protein
MGLSSERSPASTLEVEFEGRAALSPARRSVTLQTNERFLQLRLPPYARGALRTTLPYLRRVCPGRFETHERLVTMLDSELRPE